MGTKVKNRKRVNLSLGTEDAAMLAFLAGQEDVLPATKAAAYVKKGLEEDEDMYWAKLGEQRYDQWVKDGKKSYSLEEVWKEHIGSDFPDLSKT